MDETNVTGAPAPDIGADTAATTNAEGTPAEGQTAGLPFGFPTADDKTAETPAGEATAPEVPEKYTFNLPEGLKMTEELEGRFTAVAKEAGLTQAQADSLVKMHADIVTGIQKEAAQIKNDWAAECQKAGLAEPGNLRAAKLAVETFGGGDAMEALVESGVAFNPAVQRMLQNIGHLLQEDNTPDGTAVGKEQNAADLLFGNSKY